MISDNLERLSGKTVIVFASGASPKSEKSGGGSKKQKFYAGTTKKIFILYICVADLITANWEP